MNIKYVVMVVRHYFGGTLGVNKGPDALREADYSIIYYDTPEDAQEAIDKLEAGSYCLSHGEAGRPDYYILDDSDADYIIDGRMGDLSNYDWESIDCDNLDADGNACGECNSCIEGMIDQDILYVINHAYDMDRK